MKIKSHYLPVLLFWRDVEIFDIPTAPTIDKKDEKVINRFFTKGQPLPWATDNPERLSPDDNYTWVHTVFIGVAKKKRWAEIVLKTVAPNKSLSMDELERISKNGWLAAFTVDEAGRPIAESLMPASFALGVARLQQGKGLDGINEDIDKAIRDFDERRQVTEKQPDNEEQCAGDTSEFQNESQAKAIDWTALQEESDMALAQLGLSADTFSCRLLVGSVKRFKKTKELKQDGDNDYLNSFYLNDLDRLIDMTLSGKAFGPALATYLNGQIDNSKRLDVLGDHAAMNACLSPEKLPAGRWPAKSSHHLMLAQQAVVSEIVSRLSDNTGLVAVNGPPGTGKTTILRDVIADLVVQRASRLAKLNSPWQAFTKVMIAGTNIFQVKPKIVSGSSIVIACCSNKAAENITLELPDKSNIADEFLKDQLPGADYFSETAQNIFNNEANSKACAWGLVTAVLGKSDNRYKFVNGLFQETNSCKFEPGTPIDIKTLLEFWDKQDNRGAAKAKWKEAQQSFRELHNEFNENQKRLIKCQKLLELQPHLIQRLNKVKTDISRCQGELEQLPEYWAGQINGAERQHHQATAQRESVQYLSKTTELALQAAKDHLKNEEERNAVAFWERWLEVIGLRTQKVKNWRAKIIQLRAERAEAAKCHSEAQASLNRAHQAQQDALRQLQEAQESEVKERQRLQSNLNKYQAQAGRVEKQLAETHEQLNNIKDAGATLPDEAFFALREKRRHLSSVWVTVELDRLRARLFLAALELHKWTVCACAGKYIANLRMFKKMLLNDTSEPLTENERRVLWDALFFLVPAVSTTLASFDRLFRGMGKESLGWLLIDEAGQATPQSVVGALWRSRRAVVIGDPLQIEPVMTVPKDVVAELRKRHNVDGYWSPADQSAQTLADQSMNLGTWVGSVWTGLPLRAHRRCIDPMFYVANKIAYAEQMVQANTNPPTIDCVLGESTWFDVPGVIAKERHVVAEEMRVLHNLLIRLRSNWPTLSDGKRAEVFIITPFRDVAGEAREVRCRAGLKGWPVECGTVHTFQGKQAEIVFIVLGSEPGRGGDGSRNWASKSPNLLNVALTRAKLRVYVIGNYNDWNNLPGFSILVKSLDSVTDTSVHLLKT